MQEMNSAGRRGILLVEDDLLLANVEKSIIQQMGFEIIGEASTGEEAIKKAQSMVPAVIIMDISLDGNMDGWEAVRCIRKELDIPVIYTSGRSGQMKDDRTTEDNDLIFMIKPISYDKLKITLERFISPADVAAE